MNIPQLSLLLAGIMLPAALAAQDERYLPEWSSLSRHTEAPECTADFCTVDFALNAHGVGVPAERVHSARCWTADIASGHAEFACGIL